jgi:hypothetical protein
MKKVSKFIIISILSIGSASLYAEGVDIVTLTTTGIGRTKDEAVTDAQRNALEQAFGTFISSKTDIVNDEIIKDEIVSVSNGNIKKSEVLSSNTLSDGEIAVTVKVEVSVLKLTKFSQSKGIEVEFEGELFAANIKLQQLYESNELKALENLKMIVENMLENCFDYKITVSEPKQTTDPWLQNQWEITSEVSISVNKNINNVQSLIEKTMSGLNMSKEDIENYDQLNKPVVVYQIGEKIFYLRNKDSEKKLEELTLSVMDNRYRFAVDNGLYIKTFGFEVIVPSRPIDDVYHRLVVNTNDEQITTAFIEGKMYAIKLLNGRGLVVGIFNQDIADSYTELSERGIRGDSEDTKKGVLKVGGKYAHRIYMTEYYIRRYSNNRKLSSVLMNTICYYLTLNENKKRRTGCIFPTDFIMATKSICYSDIMPLSMVEKIKKYKVEPYNKTDAEAKAKAERQKIIQKNRQMLTEQAKELYEKGDYESVVRRVLPFPSDFKDASIYYYEGASIIKTGKREMGIESLRKAAEMGSEDAKKLLNEIEGGK